MTGSRASATRRTVLRGSALLAALAPGFVGGEASAASTRRAGLYRRRRFRHLRGRSFRLEGDGGRWRVRLARVGNLPHCERRAEHAFSLTFRAAKVGPPQGTYVLTRPGFAPTSLFVVPRDAQRRTIEAVVFGQP
jgi:hypothetical protein